MHEDVVSLASLQPIFWIIGLLFGALLIALPFIVSATNRSIKEISGKVDKYGTATTEISTNLQNVSSMLKDEIRYRHERETSTQLFEKETTTRLANIEARLTVLENNNE